MSSSYSVNYVARPGGEGRRGFFVGASCQDGHSGGGGYVLRLCRAKARGGRREEGGGR